MIEELRHFVAIVETGSFRAAAERVHLSQPALSASVARLESEVGTRLLVRGRKGAVVSPAGEVFLPKARLVLSALASAKQAVGEFAGLRSGEVRIGGTATVCAHYLPPHLMAFRKRFPQITLRVRESTSLEIEESLAAGELDLGLVSGRRGETWRVDELVFVSRPKLDWGELSRAPFLTFRKGATSRELLEERFPRVNIVMEFSSVEAIKEHVRIGVGVALVSRVAVERELRGGALVVLPYKPGVIRRTLRIIKRDNEHLGPAARELYQALKDARVVV